MSDNLDKYDEKLSELRISVADLVFATLNPFKATELSLQAWIGLLAQLWPDVSDARYAASEAARDFYDAERIKHIGERRDTFLATYDPDDFQDAMEEYREDISAPYIDDDKGWLESLSKTASGVIREVDNGARLTLTEATLLDDAAGFARIDPQPPSCGFCRVLISRGPVYTVGEFQKNSFAYHRNDTCTLVPVFDEDDYPGKDQVDKADDDYRKAVKLAKDEGIKLFTAMERVTNG